MKKRYYYLTSLSIAPRRCACLYHYAIKSASLLEYFAISGVQEESVRRCRSATIDEVDRLASAVGRFYPASIFGEIRTIWARWLSPLGQVIYFERSKTCNIIDNPCAFLISITHFLFP